MSEIVKDRIYEITPAKEIDTMTLEEIEDDCSIAFEIIGYAPKNLHKAASEVFLRDDIVELCEFIYEVWRCDE